MDKVIQPRVGAHILLFLTLFWPLSACAAWPTVNGFAEFSYGVKLSDDQTNRDNFNLLEERFQLNSRYFVDGENFWAARNTVFNFKGDFTIDEYYSGRTDFELREMNMSLTPFDSLDVKLGRQALTWGTGDYLFINDLFPKDYVSFFIGRDDEYLKKPSDAVKASFYPSFANIDFVIIPSFTPNTIPEGRRLSFFDSFQGGIAGRQSHRLLLEPAWQMENNEYAARVYRLLGNTELAFYFFQGFDKNPRSYKNEAIRQLYYQRLDAYGWSLLGPFLKGIGSVEFGYYNSREDSQGTNRLIENSALKMMTGYTKDMGNDLKIGWQYLYEQKLDYDEYRDNLSANDYFWDEYRHLITTRITKLFKNQTVLVSLFVFYSPSDHDGYSRPSINYDMTDQLKISFGANLPWGEDDHTEFGQMKRNKNIYCRLRYSF